MTEKIPTPVMPPHSVQDVEWSDSKPAVDVAARVRAALAQNPGAMTMQLARDLGLPEVEIIRAMPDGGSVELDVSRWQEIFQRLESVGTVHVVVSNGAATLEAVGQFGNFSTWGEFFNVQTDTLDMHIRYRNLAAVFAVKKPSHTTGHPTLSLQFYDLQGAAALKVFFNFGGKATAESLTQFQALQEEFRKHHGPGQREEISA